MPLIHTTGYVIAYAQKTDGLLYWNFMGPYATEVEALGSMMSASVGVNKDFIKIFKVPNFPAWYTEGQLLPTTTAEDITNAPSEDRLETREPVSTE